MSTRPGALQLLIHPYDGLLPLTGDRAVLRSAARRPGSALVWCMGTDAGAGARDVVERRPGGLALIVVLPPVEDLSSDAGLVLTVQSCRPHGILPHHDVPEPRELAQVLRRPPLDLAAEVTEYLTWRGLGVDRDTVHLVRRIIELSSELRSVTALSRGMYLSRRALGRRLMSRGLPVPSHWLQLGRLLRITSRLQNTDASLFSVAYEAGYPDGFSVSNQMHRLTGYRPSEVRKYLGWEWLLEEWLRKEAEAGGLSPNMASQFEGGEAGGIAAPMAPARRRSRRRAARPASA